MNTKTLIVMNMTYHHLWKQGMVNRNFHLLRELQRSQLFDRIVSVDVLPLSASKIARVALSSRPWKKNAHTVYSGVGYRIDNDPVYPSTSYVSSYGMRSLFRALARLNISVRSSIVWSYDPLSVEALCAREKPQTLIFDAVDNWMEHPAYTRYVDRVRHGYAYIRSNADLIFTVSEGLLDMFDRAEHAFFIPNGVDVEHFLSTEHVLKDFAASHESPVIGYHGVIQSRMNVAIIEQLAAKHPEYTFRLIGPVWKDMRAQVKALCKAHTNVEVRGAVPYVRLPESLHGFDCAFIPHKIDAFTHSMNPLKLYEYLAAGLPIVSTPVAGADQFQDLVRFAVSAEDFSREIQRALATDSIEMRERRRAMASQHTWSQRFVLMRQIMERARVI